MENEAKSPSSVCVENSERLAENIKGLDQAVKDMQLLVESQEKLGDDELTQPELIAHVKEMQHLLDHHYNKLPENEMMDYKITNGQLHNLFVTPDKKLSLQKVEAQVVSSDSSLSSSGGNFDITPAEVSESSLLSSDSDSESCNSSSVERLDLLSSEKLPKHEIVNVGTVTPADQQNSYEMLMRLSDYQEELKVSKEKLLFAEEEIAKLKSEMLKNEAFVIKMSSMEAQLVSAENQIKLQEADIQKEKRISLMLQRQVVELETQLESEKGIVQELQESVRNCTAKLLDRDLVIQKLNADLQDASGTFALEKWQLESSVSKLSEQLKFHEGRANELQKQCESFEAEKIMIAENQEALQHSWNDNIKSAKIELNEKISLVDTLNKNLDELKLNYDVLMTEKDGASAELQKLNADLSVRDDQIQGLECILLELKSENKHLCAEADSGKKLIAELKSRIIELEKEVEMQAAMISDTAEGKREAIRQLCFSIDHFRSAYQELHEEYAIRKRPAVMVS